MILSDYIPAVTLLIFLAFDNHLHFSNYLAFFLFFFFGVVTCFLCPLFSLLFLFLFLFLLAFPSVGEICRYIEEEHAAVRTTSREA